MELFGRTNLHNGDVHFQLTIRKGELLEALESMTASARMSVMMSDREDRPVVERLVMLTRVARAIEELGEKAA